MSTDTSETRATGFWAFYADAYREDHRHPINVALHMLGTISGLMLIVASFTIISPWWALTFPLVHAGPGLIGHRLLDRDEAIGDLRLARTDYPLWWFVAANHLALWDRLRGKA